MRRRMMMQTEKSGAKYPLVNGRHEFDDGTYVEISDGNHVMLYRGNAVGSRSVNLSNILQNGNTSSSNSNINNKPPIYTIPSGVQTKFEVKNIHGTGGMLIETNFRLANSIISGSYHTGQFSALNPENNTIASVVLEAAEDVGCLFLYQVGGANGNVIEFDVEFTVNGERWI